MTLLANAWVERGVDVSLVTIGSTTNDTYQLDPAVMRIGLDLLGRSENSVTAALNNIRRVRRLRAVIRELRADVVVSFMTSVNVLSVLAAQPLRLPVVVSERIWPEAEYIGRAWTHLRRYAYRRAAAVIAQTHRAARSLQKEIPGAIVEVVANPILVDSRETADRAADMVLSSCYGYNLVLGAGRLSKQKGFDLLIRAFARLAAQRRDWRLAIFGDGPERDALVELSRELNISNQVILPGFSHSLHIVMRRAQMFVLSSRYEGMPNALAEAMACGAACISLDCPAGPAELISHGRNGLLVPPEDVEGLTSAMEFMMQNEESRRRMGDAAEKSMSIYSIEETVNRWDELFARTVKRAGLRGTRETAGRFVGRRA